MEPRDVVRQGRPGNCLSPNYSSITTMKITKALVKEFEHQQKEFGTKVAIYNIVWTIATNLLKDIGIKHIKAR
jgi:hypothetical protein